MSRALHFRPGLDLELDIGKKKRKKRRKSNLKKKRLSNIREEKNKSFFFDLDERKISRIEFMLKKENIPGQVFLSFFSVL